MNNTSPLSKMVRKARIQLLAVLLPNAREQATRTPDIIAMLGAARLHGMVMEIDYTDSHGVRTTREVEVVEFDGTNVLTNCRKRNGDFRKFTVANVHSARWSGDIYSLAPTSAATIPPHAATA